MGDKAEAERSIVVETIRTKFLKFPLTYGQRRVAHVDEYLHGKGTKAKTSGGRVFKTRYPTVRVFLFFSHVFNDLHGKILCYFFVSEL